MSGAVLSLLAGVVLAGIGGELFLRGVLGVARALRVPAAIAAATLGAFATSSPEVFVSTVAASRGAPEIGFGDAIGSNVVNIALILALAILLRPMRCPRGDIRVDYLAALGTGLLLAALAFDGSISRIDGIVLMAAFVAWMTIHVRAALRHRAAQEPAPAAGAWRARLACAAGLGLLVLAGVLVVSGATQVATALGIPAFLIGATLVALGTSMPELATTLVAVLRGHDDVGAGTLLGSNVFNATFIVGIAAIITPIDVQGIGPWLMLGVGSIAVAATWPGERERLGRVRGMLLVLLYGTGLSLLAVFGG